VNKAARRLALLRSELLAGIQLDADNGAQAIIDMGLVEGWRELHAAPLRATSANLRHYVRPRSAKASANVSVTQRLKKFSTILDKLNRYPKMQLSRMEDVGGVRAILPAKGRPTRSPGVYVKIGRFIATATMSATPSHPAIGRCT